MRSMRRGAWGGWVAAALLAGCGGGGGNPLSNPDSVENPSGSVAGRKLSYAYFQFCINPIFNADLQVNINGNVSTNKCASSGCHDSVTGNGGSFRLVGSATNGTVTATTDAERTALRATPMYKNYYSAQGSTVVGSVALSNLLNKPRVFRVLHAGGTIFLDAADPNVKLIEYWITHPTPSTGDEFDNSASMFTGGVPQAGACIS